MRACDLITEGGKSSAVRYNSEIGLLYAFAGNGEFDLENLESSFDLEKLDNPEQILSEIKTFLGDNFNEKIFSTWVNVGNVYREKIAAHSGHLPQSYGWAGGSNATDSDNNVSDILFHGHSSGGMSVKDKGGITLANLTPKALGIEPSRGTDVFAHYAADEFNKMKQLIFSEVLDIARQAANQRLSFLNDKYAITYVADEDMFMCEGKKTIKSTAEDILNSIGVNSPWQRVFGDWFQKNWSTKKEYAIPLYKKIAVILERVMEQNLSSSESIANVLRFGEMPYYYVTPSSIYFVPSRNDIHDLQVKSIKYGAPDGTSQKFLANIGNADSNDFATVDIYIRYANGMFETNPTVRVQSLKNPQFIAWDKL
jgi:hypothetical protein